ncbi:MAG TPA: IclR family transcriptional regulator C-terminal domain-containing protein, partial [Terriglobales bacterium]|nr:IclR family transcriptional regulator C-terminal domain-containing protein [Terriglobales bacterium]
RTPVAEVQLGVPARTPADDIAALGGDPNFMTSLARGLAVIQAFSEPRQRLTISHLSSRTGLSRAAVRRCLYTLTKLGLTGCDDTYHFFLRPRVLALGYSYISSTPLATAAQPVLEHISHLLHESCSIATLDGFDIVYIARFNVTRIMSVDLGIGSRLPAFCTSMGRVLLAHLPEPELDSFLGRVPFTRYTDRTVVEASRLRELLQVVRRAGYAIVDQELELGLRSLAVPIQTHAGNVAAALNIGTHAQRITLNELQTRFLPQLRLAAQELGMLLR